ncbi:MAG: zinc metallopeptidase [Clostridia bacterium]|nr:zinc metallopeptidase [Clostridia bacterium]MBO7289004.1 zinc metallopeptidase [Clostridia bacterium]
MFWYGFDYYYLVLIVPAIIISFIAQAKVSSTFSKFSRVANMRGLTGAEAARRILDMNGLSSVVIEHVKGNLTDHYDPKSRVLRLSDSVFSSKSVAALGVAAHECGHAIQHAKAYAPLKIRNSVFPVVNISSSLAVPIIMLGLIFNTPFLIDAGIILFSAVVFFQLVTLPVEFNASRRALAILEDSYFLEGSEIKSARKVLSAAALTYVASALLSVMQLLRLILISNNRRK